jgi:hypothetical protein
MHSIARSLLCALCIGSVCIGAGLAEAGSPDEVVLAPHRAVYDLSLASTRGKSSMEAVRGRILYDFSGNRCEGYSLQFRQVSELDTGEGKRALSDLRSTTWEEGSAKTFRFNSENSLDQHLLERVDGRAERTTDDVTVTLAKPEAKTLKLPANMVFPTEHMRRIIAAAREGKTILALPVYDGSENGQKVYDTTTIIGKPIPPDQRKPDDAAAAQAAVLAAMHRWPVTISYFDHAAAQGEQTPVYAIGFELYENGISRALSLDYNDFVLSGQMSTLEIKEAAPCR